MKDEEIRIAIAEACGWRWEQPFNKRKKENRLIPPSGRACILWKDGGLGGNLPPNYPHDLNAMQSALDQQTVAFCIEFDRRLTERARVGSSLVCLLPPSAWAEEFMATHTHLSTVCEPSE